MDWPLLEADPQVGDVLSYHKGAQGEMIVLVLRSYMESRTHCVVDVFWITGCDEDDPVSTHYGKFSSWKGWRKAPS